jgi:hypothetical protein
MIAHLSTLPTGPALAFESLIKLAGNLNSHSTGEETPDDRASIAAFYNTLDDAMRDVIGKRFMSLVSTINPHRDGGVGSETEGEGEGEEQAWDVPRDVRRLEKTGAFLKREMGVRNYFLQRVELLNGEEGVKGGGDSDGEGENENGGRRC